MSYKTLGRARIEAARVHSLLSPSSAASSFNVQRASAIDYSFTVKATAQADLLAALRDHFLFDDFATIESWLHAHPAHYSGLFAALPQIDTIFGSGKDKWLTVIEDWEGTRNLLIEVAFGGSGDDASMLCHRMIAEWLLSQEDDIRRSFDFGVRFV